VWTWSNLGKFGHGQAIALLHGTDDANVPYGQSVGGREAYRDVGYPMVHLRTLWGRDHRPHWVEAANELAWCEGMVSPDVARVGASLDALAGRSRTTGPTRDPNGRGAEDRRARRRGAAGAARRGRGAASPWAGARPSLGKGKLAGSDGNRMGPACACWRSSTARRPAPLEQGARADLAAVDKLAERGAATEASSAVPTRRSPRLGPRAGLAQRLRDDDRGDAREVAEGPEGDQGRQEGARARGGGARCVEEGPHRRFRGLREQREGLRALIRIRSTS
jgi:hypothetical protein